jgi:hypothetical protein
MSAVMARFLASAPLLAKLLTLAACATSAVACSSSNTEATPPPAPPTWDAAPLTLAIYDGRVAKVEVAIASSDPTKLTVTATSASAPAELVAAEAPSTDGLWHGTIKIRPGYALPAGPAGVITVDIRDAASGVALQKTIALETHKLAWKQRVIWTATTGPQTREHATFFVDHQANAAYLLQGSGYAPQFKPIEDSWRLDIASGKWSPWAPTGDVPPPGGSRRIAEIPGGKKFYAYGGYVGFEATADDEGDIYRVDLADAAHTFTKLKNVTPGPSRELHAVAYDAKSETFVVFGGVTAKTQEVLDDSWTVKIAGDTATWTALPGKGPTGRYGSFTAFDAESRRLVVWSGAQAYESTTDPINAAQDAWALDLAADPPAWSKLEPTGTAPKGRRNGCSMPDPAGRRLFVYGGTSDGKTTEKGLFVLDLEPGHEAWTQLELASAPPPRSSGFGFATSAGDVTCAFGNDNSGFRDVSFLGYAGGVE